MKITVLCGGKTHPVYPYLLKWKEAQAVNNEINLTDQKKDVGGGDILFLISCPWIIQESIRSKFQVSLVVHASALPKGRGWSPHIYQILEGKNEIPITLLEASDPVDSGNIWKQVSIKLKGHELFDEINHVIFNATTQLMDFAIDNLKSVKPKPQNSKLATYYSKRSPEDSRLDPKKSIVEQFNLMRVADENRFPLFFDYFGHRYKVILKKEKTIPQIQKNKKAAYQK